MFTGDRKFGTSLLDPIERRFKDFIIPKIPLSIETYHLTLSTFFWSFIVIMGGFLAKYDFVWLNLITVGILGQYITDLIDGELGRRRKTGLLRWGFYMDHFLDYVFLVSLLLGYSFVVPLEQKYILFVTLGILGGYMVNTLLLYGATGKFAIFYKKIGPSEVRMAFVVINTIIFFFGRISFQFVLPYFFIMCFFGLIIVAYSTHKKLWDSEMISSRRMFDFRHSGILLSGLLVCIGLVLSVFVYHAHKTNPFISNTIFRPSIESKKIGDNIVSFEKYQIRVSNSVFAHAFAYFKLSMTILFDVEKENVRENSLSLDLIYKQAHNSRFDPDTNPYLITGGHFSVLYPRNLGVFYYPLLDSSIKQSQEEWVEKQRLYLQALHFTIDVLTKCGDVYTTIVPIDANLVTCVNIYSYPSDSLYGVLHAFDSLIYSSSVSQNSKEQKKLLTVQAAHELLQQYKEDINKMFLKYDKKIFDSNTQLVKKSISLASAKDAVKRKSSFYDNVIYWKTLDLMDKLDIRQTKENELENLKAHIIQSFWNENQGFFTDDLSLHSGYSSDWLIAYSTGFLNVNNARERQYYNRAVDYIEKNNIAKPFPIKYEINNNQNTVLLVKLFAPDYQTDTLWSFWGLEYIKLLYSLSRQTGDQLYRLKADSYYEAYVEKVTTHGGMSELFDSKSGNPYKNSFYKSVANTGWIINLQQIDAMKEEFGYK